MEQLSIWNKISFYFENSVDLRKLWADTESVFSKQLNLSVISFALIIFGICILAVLFVFIIGTRRKTKQEPKPEPELDLCREEVSDERFQRMEEIVQAQAQQMEAMQTQLDEAAKLRHDFRQELLLLREFAQDGDRQAIEQYLPEIHSEQQVADISICRNMLVNTIYKHYYHKAIACGIEIDALIEADETLWLTASDISVLFGNLLENAVIAAADAAEGERKLRIRTSQTADSLVIAMGNTFGTPRISTEDGNFASTKPAHKGIGLSSIRRIATAYHGEAKFVLDEELFMSYVILFRPLD